MVTIKASCKSNNKNNPTLNLIRYNKKITRQSITKIQNNVRLIEKVKSNYIGVVEKELIISLEQLQTKNQLSSCI